MRRHLWAYTYQNLGISNYTYDFGDNWLHSIKIEQVDDEEVDIWHFIDSKGEDPQEDMGGVCGFLAYRDGEHPWNESED